MKTFALIGAAGYVAPRHMRAIRDTGNRLVAALDPNDSVGIIDSYFPDADFFTQFERFDRHIDKQRRKGAAVDYISICSPNYLHDSHVRFALRSRAHAICEKPLVLTPWNVDALEEIEAESDRRVYTVLQLRQHPTMIAARERLAAAPKHKRFDVVLTYITARGKWYGTSWKNEPEKSGGVGTNIGVHFFDILIWLFGEVLDSVVHLNARDVNAGYLELERARVSWFLSINREDLPDEVRIAGKRTYRALAIDGREIEFSDGFEDLHTQTYREILAGGGFGIADARPAVELTHQIRTAPAGVGAGLVHPFYEQAFKRLNAADRHRPISYPRLRAHG